MHVVLCTDGVFPHALGGMQRHSRLLAEHLARSGRVKITVVHPHALRVFDTTLGIREVRITDIDPKRFYLRELWRYSGRVDQELRRLDPDVVLSQGFSVWKGMRRWSDRLIVHPHGLEMFQGLSPRERLFGAPFRAALRHMVRRSAVTVSLGGKLTAILRGLAAGSACRVVELPNAVDVPPAPLPYPADDGPLRLFFVGRFAFNKGIDLLMAVARRLEEEGLADRLHFDLAGDGPLLAGYREAGLPRNVRLLGRVDDDALFHAYGQCHALLLPTRFEGMPTVVLEAMARARPILVSDVGATAVLVDKENGFLLPPGDAEALYRGIRAFLDLTQARREAMGIASHRRASADFDWPVVAGRFIDLFEELASGKHLVQ